MTTSQWQGGSIDEANRLVLALQRVKDTGKKSLIRSTDHYVALQQNKAEAGSSSKTALVEEADDEICEGGNSSVIREPSRSDESTLILTSWKTQEFAYRKTSKIGYSDDDELPTLARGLFTCTEGEDQHRIVVRGYDKFFNEGEMPWTKPDAIAAYSRPPYELSFKENGCIIFIAALSSHQLIVTSKHSLGANESKAISHAQKGEEWLARHLQSVNKTKRDLAQQLWNRNETAVAELCDDTFEEHVLAYPPERTGLHLHGLNANSADFQTRSMKEVETFARYWGFLPTRYLVMDSIEEVNTFTRTIAETGTWQGTAIEGFVVRTRMPSDQDSIRAQDITSSVVAPPYAKGQTWFYKVKFDEPYLMYRDWRELTRRMLSDKEAYEKDPKADQLKKPELPAVSKKRPETQLFVHWCYEQMHGSLDGSIAARPELFQGLSQNAGIIKLRELFLEYMKSEKGKEEMKRWQKSTALTTSTVNEIAFTKTLIVPIAIPGCGKTALGIALTHLFKGIDHIQSDDVQTKRTGPTFLRNTAKALEENTIVFADRNNHLYKHRDEIVKCVADWENAASTGKIGNTKQGSKKKKKEAPVIEGGASGSRRVRLIALVWPMDDLPLNQIHHICCDRIVKRGANHQSLRVEQGNEHEQVLWHFLQTRQEFNSVDEITNERGNGGDQAFHDVIRVDVRSTFDDMVQKAVQELSPLLGLPFPSQQEINQAMKQARLYRVSIKKESKGIPGAPTRYYGLSVEVDLSKLLQPLVKDHAEASTALNRLVSVNRIISRPHVTLVHNSELKSASGDASEQEITTSQIQAQKKWEFYSELLKDEKAATEFNMQIDCVAWNDRAISLGVSNVFNEQCGSLDCLQGGHWRPHITVGTFQEDIRPYEGNRVLQEADLGSAQVSCIQFGKPLSVVGRLRALA